MIPALHCVYNNSLDFPPRIPHYLLMAETQTPAEFFAALRANSPAVTTATAYQLYMRDAFGHHVYRDGDAWGMSANPERYEVAPCGVAHIPYADEDAAEEWARSWERANPMHGPARRPTGGFPVSRPSRPFGPRQLFTR